MSQKVTILRGLPASGKTTWAHRQVELRPETLKRLNKDEIRHMLHCGIYSEALEPTVLQVRDTLLETCLKAGHSVLVDDTNLNPKHIEHLKKLCKSILPTIKVEIKDFDTPIEECITRDGCREHPVGKGTIIEMYERWVK